MGVQQGSVVLGHCTAGGAYVPGLSDYNVIVRGTGAIFLAGPPLVKAATGEDVSVDELGGCDMHTSVSGTADYPASSEQEAIAIARDIVAQFKRPLKSHTERSEEHTSELQSLMRTSYAVFCLKKKKQITNTYLKRPQKKIKT